MIVGTEWLVEAINCDHDKLRSLGLLQNVFARVITDLKLKVVGEQHWHQFSAPGAGVTGLAMLTESHLACHTYPEHKTATFNLYCCRERPEWNWTQNLQNLLGAGIVNVQKIERGQGNATVPVAVPSASRARLGDETSRNPFQTKFGTVKIRNRGYLPHWEKENGVYFVTFRLGDSLPQTALQKIKAERDLARRALVNLERRLSPLEERKLAAILCEKIDGYLDAGSGECHLNNPQIAEIVANSLRHFDNQRYQLLAWCLMPNHIHIVFRLLSHYELSEVLHSWKSYTAKESNKILGKTGEFWGREYYDHLVRDQADFARIINYVINNPIKAGLKDWKWVWVAGNLQQNLGDASAERAQHSRQDDGVTAEDLSQ